MDSFTRRQIWLQRYGSTVANGFDDYLKQVDRIIRQVLADDIPSKRALLAIERELQSQLLPVYTEYTDYIVSQIKQLADYEAEFTQEALNRWTDETISRPSPDLLWAAIADYPIQKSKIGESDLLDSLLAKFSQSEVERIQGIVRTGWAQGATIQEISQAIRGTRSARYSDGALAISARNAKTIARTLVNHAANQAKMATYADNADIVKQWQFTATLDHRTSEQCRGYDGQVFALGEGPVPPLHYGCRSLALPYFDDPELDGRTRMAKGAGEEEGEFAKSHTVPAGSYYEWLKTQPAWFQDEVLGQGKAEIFRKSGLDGNEFRDLITTNFGKEITLQELKNKVPDAWK